MIQIPHAGQVFIAFGLLWGVVEFAPESTIEAITAEPFTIKIDATRLIQAIHANPLYGRRPHA